MTEGKCMRKSKPLSSMGGKDRTKVSKSEEKKLRRGGCGRKEDQEKDTRESKGGDYMYMGQLSTRNASSSHIRLSYIRQSPLAKKSPAMAILERTPPQYLDASLLIIDYLGRGESCNIAFIRSLQIVPSSHHVHL